MLFDLVLYVCINACEPVVFEPPALFDSEFECQQAAEKYHTWVGAAVREEHKDHGHGPNWTFYTTHDCVPHEPERLSDAS